MKAGTGLARSPGRRTGRGRLGAALSVSALGFSIATLVDVPDRPCPGSATSTSFDLTPVLLFALLAGGVVLNVRSVRRGGAFWGRIGLASVSLAAILGIWAAGVAFSQPACS
jgi:hypothetical protein